MLSRRETIKAGFVALFAPDAEVWHKPEQLAQTHSCLVELGDADGNPHIIHTNGYAPIVIQLDRIGSEFFYPTSVEWIVTGGYVEYASIVYTTMFAPIWKHKTVQYTKHTIACKYDTIVLDFPDNLVIQIL